MESRARESSARDSVISLSRISSSWVSARWGISGVSLSRVFRNLVIWREMREKVGSFWTSSSWVSIVSIKSNSILMSPIEKFLAGSGFPPRMTKLPDFSGRGRGLFSIFSLSRFSL